MITVRDLRKDYRVFKRPPGLGAAFRALFKRTYQTVHAVDGISFDIAAGERVGFLGPNGAGKTTTLKILAGLLHPTSGEARVDGHLPQKREDAFLSKIMLVMGQKQQLLWDLPPSETFELNRAIYDVPPAQFEETMHELVTLLEIADVVNKPSRTLSLGERMKCELAAALVHRPKVLFLDEPTIGLDVSMQLAIREFIQRYNERSGATVLLTSHDMDDVTALCPRVLVIDHGALTYDGDLRALVRRVRPRKRVVVRALDGVETLDVAQEELQPRIAAILAHGRVADLTVEDPPLEEVMRELFHERRVALQRPAAEPQSSERSP